MVSPLAHIVLDVDENFDDLCNDKKLSGESPSKSRHHLKSRPTECIHVVFMLQQKNSPCGVTGALRGIRRRQPSPLRKAVCLKTKWWS